MRVDTTVAFQFRFAYANIEQPDKSHLELVACRRPADRHCGAGVTYGRGRENGGEKTCGAHPWPTQVEHLDPIS